MQIHTNKLTFSFILFVLAVATIFCGFFVLLVRMIPGMNNVGRTDNVQAHFVKSIITECTHSHRVHILVGTFSCTQIDS